jgi:hypothetical protein
MCWFFIRRVFLAPTAGVLCLLRIISFIYGLDDPYIHLALSERITRGEYGINPGEIASPSSSVIYPFLLTLGFFYLNIPEAFPFWLSLISMAGALWMVAGFIWDRVAENGTPPSHWFIILAV